MTESTQGENAPEGAGEEDRRVREQERHRHLFTPVRTCSGRAVAALRRRARQAVRQDEPERGAVAVLVVLVLALVALPASALGLTTFVRANTLAELQQTADAAALAGASTIPLGDSAYALAFAGSTAELLTGQDLPASGVGNTLGGSVDPLDNACRAANEAVKRMSSAGTWSQAIDEAPPRTDGYLTECAGPASTGPGSTAGWARVKYFQDQSVVRSLGDCLDAAQGQLAPVSPMLPPEVQERIAQVEQTLDGLEDLLPALLRPGVVVQVRQRVEGPLDALLGAREPTLQVATSRARRRAKNLVVLPFDTVTGLSPASTVGDSSQTAEDALRNAAALLRSLPGSVPLPGVGNLPDLPDLPGLPVPAPGLDDLPTSVPLPTAPLRSCADVIDAALDDYDDLVAPADANSVEDTLRQAAAGDEPITVVLLGPSSTFFDTLTVCSTSITGAVRPSASLARPDADGDGIPERVEVGAEVQVRVDSDEVLEGVRCQPGTPGSFRASLVRE